MPNAAAQGLPRRATQSDIPELVRVVNLAYRVEDFFIHGDRVDSAEVERLLDVPDAGFLVSADPSGQRLVAAVYCRWRAPVGFFALLAVDPAIQGQGLGRSMVRAVEDHCREFECTSLEIHVVDLRTELPSFYRSMGFRETGSLPFPNPTKLRLPAKMLTMSKAL